MKHAASNVSAEQENKSSPSSLRFGDAVNQTRTEATPKATIKKTSMGLKIAELGTKLGGSSLDSGRFLWYRYFVTGQFFHA